MHFCTICHNMYYLKIREEDGGNSLNYYCRNCGHEDTALTAETICVSETQLRRSEQKFTHMVNEYTKYDPTLPRINTIKCPNQECSSNVSQAGGNIDVQAVGVFHGGNQIQEAENAFGQNAVEDSNLLSGGAGTAADTKKKLVLGTTKNKTAKTLAKEAEESAKEAVKSAKAAEQSVKAVIAAEETAEKTLLASKKPTSKKEKENEREVIYIRYDDINMKYVYLCVHCDTTWKTDNRN